MTTIQQFVFFDFEMLCSDNGMPFADMEAIRLGAVKYNLDTEDIMYFDRFIRPSQQQPLSEFCKTLTGIQDADLLHAQDFPSVFHEFLYWVGGVKRTQFFSWSSSDISRLQLDALRHHIPVVTIQKIQKRYIDFQAIFAKRVAKTNLSVENALALYNLSFEGEKHHPMYDAYNTLRIYLAFSNDPLQSELVMLKQFIFANKDIHPTHINTALKKRFQHDVTELLEDLQGILMIRAAARFLKQTYKVVRKYENILINRAGLYDKEILFHVHSLVSFYQELLQSYEEHVTHSSKIIILHEQLLHPFQQHSI